MFCKVSSVARNLFSSLRTSPPLCWAVVLHCLRGEEVGETQGNLALPSPCPHLLPWTCLHCSEPLSVPNISNSIITHYQHQGSLGQSAYWNPPEAHLSSVPHQRDPGFPETSPFLSAWDGINLPKDPGQPFWTNHNWLHIECPWALFYFSSKSHGCCIRHQLHKLLRNCFASVGSSRSPCAGRVISTTIYFLKYRHIIKETVLMSAKSCWQWTANGKGLNMKQSWGFQWENE